MKKAIAFFVRYIIYFIIFSFILAFLHKQVVQLRNLVVGTQISYFNFELLINGFLISFPYASVIALIPTLQLSISKKYSFWQYFIPYVLICLLIWLFIIPLGSFLKNKKAISLFNIGTEQIQLTNGIFRENNKTIDFYVATNPDNSSKVLRYALPSKEYPEPALEVIDINPGRNTFYADSIVADYFNKIKTPQLVLQVLTLIAMNASQALDKGFLSYLWFATLGLAVSCMICFRRFTRWRLLNAFNILLYCCIITILNAVLYSPRFYVETSIPISVKDWLPSIVNLSISGILIVIGVIQIFIKPDPNVESD